MIQSLLIISSLFLAWLGCYMVSTVHKITAGVARATFEHGDIIIKSPIISLIGLMLILIACFLFYVGCTL